MRTLRLTCTNITEKHSNPTPAECKMAPRYLGMPLCRRHRCDFKFEFQGITDSYTILGSCNGRNLGSNYIILHKWLSIFSVLYSCAWHTLLCNATDYMVPNPLKNLLLMLSYKLIMPSYKTVLQSLITSHLQFLSWSQSRLMWPVLPHW